ncbi:MAG TPA: SMI1/KNR4 family protein [Chloroflexota bacterium]
MSAFDWRSFLATWSRAVLTVPDLAGRLPPEVVASGWLGYPGATDAQVEAAEARLGAHLPPSYREFLHVSNGWRTLSYFIDQVWSTGEIEWFRVRNQQWIDAYVEPATYGGPPISEAEHLVYGDAQDNVRFRAEYLPDCLEISAEGDSAILLLNPPVVTPAGEWEAWFFANWLPGARRHRSFRELMQAEYQSFLELRDRL